MREEQGRKVHGKLWGVCAGAAASAGATPLLGAAAKCLLAVCFGAWWLIPWQCAAAR